MIGLVFAPINNAYPKGKSQTFKAHQERKVVNNIEKMLMKNSKSFCFVLYINLPVFSCSSSTRNNDFLGMFVINISNGSYFSEIFLCLNLYAINQVQQTWILFSSESCFNIMTLRKIINKLSSVKKKNNVIQINFLLKYSISPELSPFLCVCQMKINIRNLQHKDF